jgi:putative DeoR family transcriptional regulator (stage III sporulation protein D)
MTERLPAINKQLAAEVKRILDQNKAERHLRGGEATKKKYMAAARSQGQ